MACRGPLGLIDRRNRLRVARQRRLTPVELGRIDSGQVHHVKPHLALVVEQLGARGFEKTPAGELGRAVGGLQWDPHEAQGRSDVHDRPAITWSHSGKGGHRSPRLAQECHLYGPAKILRMGVPRRSEDRGHRIVHPDVDGAELGLCLACGRIHLVEPGDVCRQDERPSPDSLHLLCCRPQALLPPRDQRHVEPLLRQRTGRRPANARGRSRDEGNFVWCHHSPSFGCLPVSWSSDLSANLYRSARVCCPWMAYSTRSRIKP